MLAVWNHGKKLSKAREQIFPKMDFKPFDGNKFTKGLENTNKKINFGKSWYIDMLRRKSDEELNSLWFSLLKEKLSIQSDQYYLAQKSLGVRNDIKVVRGKIAVSMARIKTVFAERQSINNEFTMLLEYWYIRNKQNLKKFEVDSNSLTQKMKPQLYSRKLVEVPRTKKLILEEMKKIENEKKNQLENVQKAVFVERKKELIKLKEELKESFYEKKFIENEEKELRENKIKRRAEIETKKLNKVAEKKKKIYDNKVKNMLEKLNEFKANLEKVKNSQNKEDELKIKFEIDKTRNKLRVLNMKREKELDKDEELEKFKLIKSEIIKKKHSISKENALLRVKNELKIAKKQKYSSSKYETIETNETKETNKTNKTNETNDENEENYETVKVVKNKTVGQVGQSENISGSLVKKQKTSSSESTKEKENLFKKQEYEITEHKKKRRAENNFEEEEEEEVEEKNHNFYKYKENLVDSKEDYFNDVVDEYKIKKTKEEKFAEFKEKLDEKTRKEVLDMVDEKLIHSREMLGGKYRKILFDYKNETTKEVKPYQKQLNNELDSINNFKNLIGEKQIKRPNIIKDVKIDSNKQIYLDIFEGKVNAPISLKAASKKTKLNGPLSRKEISAAKNLIARKNRKQILSYYIKNYEELSKKGQNKVYNKLQKIRSQEARNIIQKELIAIKAAVSHPESFYRTLAKKVKKVEEKKVEEKNIEEKKE